MKQVFILLLMLTLAGCLRFGDDIELSGDKFTSEHLKEITALTGIRFPAGTIGIEYSYFGSGLDPALAAKIQIPNDKQDEFLSNEIFKKGRDERTHIEIGKGKTWWRPEVLTSRIDRTQELPNAQFLECTIGHENGRLIVYLSWNTT